MEERIQKVLSRAGYGSRREIERLIVQKEVHVNGVAAELGQRISGSELISLRGQRINFADKMEVISQMLLYHKPVGEVCTRKDPEKRKTASNRPSPTYQRRRSTRAYRPPRLATDL